MQIPERLRAYFFIILFPAVLIAFVLPAVHPCRAQEPPGEDPLESLNWHRGPYTAQLGNIATVEVPEGSSYLDPSDTRRILELMHNIPDGSELGMVLSAVDSIPWFAVFSFDDVGYVRDDEGATLDADAILKTIQKNTEAANKERRKRGWSEMDVIGWRIAPAYNPTTHNLEWAIDGRERGSFEVTVNHSTRLLGRNGVMRVGLVCSPEIMDGAVTQLRSVLAAYTFNSGKRYAEFREGDKLAAYGLTGLIVGGAAVAAAKSGLFAKFLKPILIAIFAFFAAIFRRIQGWFGRRDRLT